MKTFWKILICLLFSSLLGCSSLNAPFTKHRENVSVKEHIDPKLISWNTDKKIKLLPHQLYPIDYLEKNDDVKGILVYHYLGTGKTFLSLGLAERHPNKKIVILVPRFLQSHWDKHLRLYGVKNKSRYKIVTHEKPESLIDADLSNTILIIDESHRLIEKINSHDPEQNNLYSNLYISLRNANKILSLTGTPIYSQINNIAYQVNLVSGKDLIPFNQEDFRTKFMKVSQPRSFFRGHVLESIFLPTATTLATIGVVFATATNPYVFAAGVLGGGFIPGLVKSMLPLQERPLRSFDSDQLETLGKKYISYYTIPQKDQTDYPDARIHVEDVNYNRPQVNLLLKLADSKMNTDELLQILKDDTDKKPNKKYIHINSSTIQNKYKLKPGSGREIGNIIFHDNNEIIYPNKFIEIGKRIMESKGPVVIYSHYYHNGIIPFINYLHHIGFGGDYAILDPDMSIKEHEQLINKYNEGKLKILIIHPEITEGISLFGSRQLHILEAPYNKAFQEQIIGRVVRYKSHAHLPPEERYVDVYVWKQILPPYGLMNNLALRENWHKNFSEFNYYSNFGEGRTLVDANAGMKGLSPDEIAFTKMKTLDFTMEQLREYLGDYSIERLHVK